MLFFVLLDPWHFHTLCSASQPLSLIFVLKGLNCYFKISKCLKGGSYTIYIGFFYGLFFFFLDFGPWVLATLHLSNTHMQTHTQWHILGKWLMVFTQNKERRNLTHSRQCFLAWLTGHRMYFSLLHPHFSHVPLPRKPFPLFWKPKSARFSCCISAARTLYPYCFSSSFC